MRQPEKREGFEDLQLQVMPMLHLQAGRDVSTIPFPSSPPERLLRYVPWNPSRMNLCKLATLCAALHNQTSLLLGHTPEGVAAFTHTSVQ